LQTAALPLGYPAINFSLSGIYASEICVELSAVDGILTYTAHSCEYKRMRRPTLRIVEYRHSATAKYCIEGLRVNGKRKRLFFSTRDSAERELQRLKIKQRREGETALAIPDSLRIMASECADKLKPFGKTLVDATEFFLKQLGDEQRSITVSELMTEFLGARRRTRRSQIHLADLQRRLGRFAESFGIRPIRTLTSKQIETWLHELELEPQTINNYRSRIGAMFSYAIRRELLERNPIDAIEKITIRGKPPEIFQPEELQSLLDASPPDLLPVLAIGAFAGLRTAELLRLDWKDVELTRGYIHVSAANSKTAQRRLVTLAPNLVNWLRPYTNLEGKVYSRSERDLHKDLVALCGKVGLQKWPTNGLRHSFASYHLALHKNAPELALELGHASPKMIFTNYRELVTDEQAERYWAIRLNTRAENVIPMEAEATNVLPLEATAR